MMDTQKAYVGSQIHDGHEMYEGAALVVNRAGHLSVHPTVSLPPNCPTETLNGGLITPGFVDLQVNGGGGVMFNDTQTVETLQTIANAHAATGTQAFLPTLITDRPEVTIAAINAVEQAISERVDGIVGIHLEGPHLSTARKGAHDPKLIRPMEDEDLRVLLSATDRLANVMVTIAPESVTPNQIKTLTQAGVVVSLGHTDASAQTCHTAFDAGARCVTHLFNAMSQLTSREPGLVGATLERDEIYAGLIADGIHVHPATIRVALSARPKSERVFLVTDAMACAGSGIEGFQLNGREILRKDGRLCLTDGTLAGTDLEMPRALSIMSGDVGESADHAVKRACATPAELLRGSSNFGTLTGSAKSAVYFENGLAEPGNIRVLKAS